MPAERTRSSNLQGRQKSCSECAKSKRRCDLGQPSCLRCSRQSLTCTYPPSRLPSSNSTSTSQSESTAPDITAPEAAPFHLDTPDLLHEQSVSLLDFDLTTGVGSIDALNELLNEDVDESFPPVRSSYVSGKSFSAAHLSPFARSRLDYATDQLKKAPLQMVSENGTPWCHPQLYEDEMPHLLQGCYTTFFAHNSH
jgi:hypothetical protein